MNYPVGVMSSCQCDILDPILEELPPGTKKICHDEATSSQYERVLLLMATGIKEQISHQNTDISTSIEASQLYSSEVEMETENSVAALQACRKELSLADIAAGSDCD